MSRDRETIRLLRAREPEGVRRLAEDHGARLQGALSVMFRGVLGHHDIEDATSTAIQRAWRLFSTYSESRGTLRSWLYQIGRNCALGLLKERRHASWPRSIDNVDWDLLPASPLDDSFSVSGAGRGDLDLDEDARRSDLTAERLRAVYAVIETLGPLQRGIVLADLEFGGSVSATELATRFKTTTNCIYASRSSARKAIRLRLTELGLWPNGSQASSGAGGSAGSGSVSAGSMADASAAIGSELVKKRRRAPSIDAPESHEKISRTPLRPKRRGSLGGDTRSRGVAGGSEDVREDGDL